MSYYVFSMQCIDSDFVKIFYYLVGFSCLKLCCCWCDLFCSLQWCVQEKTVGTNSKRFSVGLRRETSEEETATFKSVSVTVFSVCYIMMVVDKDLEKSAFQSGRWSAVVYHECRRWKKVLTRLLGPVSTTRVDGPS